MTLTDKDLFPRNAALAYGEADLVFIPVIPRRVDESADEDTESNGYHPCRMAAYAPIPVVQCREACGDAIIVRSYSKTQHRQCIPCTPF